MTQDLVVVCADLDAEQALKTMLSNNLKLGTAPFSFSLYRHQGDSNCRNSAHDFLKPFVDQYRFALVVFDHHGSGDERVAPDEVRRQVLENLSRAGWQGRCEAIVIAPELEAWVWSESPNVAQVMGWESTPKLRRWLQEQSLWPEQVAKPSDPKSAYEKALRQAKKARSARIFAQLAEHVSYKGCQDASFNLLLDTLKGWFPPQEANFT
ncbi:MAG: hypothetical protein NZ750_07050 [Anaerolineae bacterium]|nr:hypothetical protein [Anaerolineae bacterium]MDW8170868.1 hypothetical protein [Anaerolineae bacterium]